MNAQERKRQGQRKGGRTQTDKKHWCELCQVEGQGPRFEQYHVTQRLCGGGGVKNYWSRMRRA